jgi:ABC-2 type transport system ATP-binding protein
MSVLNWSGVLSPHTARLAPGEPAGDLVLDVRDLRMRYGRNEVLAGVSFTARRGEVLALLGPNGAGKTTTIEILEGFRMRSSGQVNVLGTDPAHGGEAWRARIGVVLQSWRDHGKWQVRELLAHLGSYYAPYSGAGGLLPRPWDVDELIATVGLTGQARQRVRRLSGGQRRRLDVAIGIVGRPELLFLDEPTAGFDPEARREFHDLVHRLADREEATILLTTHDLDEAEKLADRILILAGGRIVADGSADALSRRMSTQAEVRWSRDGQRFVHSADEPTRFVRELFRQYGESVEDLEVRRASLEDTYMALVRQAETGGYGSGLGSGEAIRKLTVVAG